MEEYKICWHFSFKKYYFNYSHEVTRELCNKVFECGGSITTRFYQTYVTHMLFDNKEDAEKVIDYLHSVEVMNKLTE